MPRKPYTAAEMVASFWSRVNKTDGCWEWLGATNEKGYGRFYTKSRPALRAHVFAWELENGAIPNGLVTRHTCDNRLCVRVSHLMLGTNADNSRDMVERGRSVRGERHWYASLSDEQVAQIRTLIASGVRQRELIKMFESTSATISRIATGKTRTLEAHNLCH